MKLIERVSSAFAQGDPETSEMEKGVGQFEGYGLQPVHLRLRKAGALAPEGLTADSN